MEDEYEDEAMLKGETVEIDSDVDDVEDTEDGGAIVKLDEDEPAGKSDFYANLAEVLPEEDLRRIGRDFLELLARDKEARKKRDEQYEEGLRRTGLGDDAPGGADFQGASKVVHPMLTQVSVDFAARAIKELFPPQGPVKDYIVGEPTGAKVKKAKRKTAFMNWQLTVQSPEFRAELEQLLTQVPLGGAQYLKITWREDRNRPEFLFVAIDDIYLPFAATNFYSAQRKTHVQYLTQLEYKQRVRSGMYRDVDLIPASMEPDRSLADQANDKIEGRSDTSYNEDGLRTIFEIYATAEIEGDEPAPYIISIDKATGKVLAIYRNWDEQDPAQEELQWLVEFPFVPWRGAYPIGITHMIGGLSAAATGALRALLDSAHIQNAPTMLKLKGGSKGGQTLGIQPTQVMEIEGGLNVDDIRKTIMPVPFNPPSSTLFQLLGFLVDAGNNVIRTTLDDISDQNPNAPVGTTLAKMEQGMVVFSAIHQRLHDAMARMLRILHRLNAMYLNDEDVEEEVGEELATREDFEGPLDVVPVSDPNIFSEAQRFAQVQAVAQRAAMLPQLYDVRKVEERILDTLKIPNAKELLMPSPEGAEQNAVDENAHASMGQPIKAYPDQDHIAHIQTHLTYLMNPMLGSNPLIAPQYIPAILNHLKEHLVLWYTAQVFDVGSEATGLDLTEATEEAKKDDDKRALDRMLAQASTLVSQSATQVFQSLMPVLQQVQQMAAQFQPPMPMDPTQAAMAETQRRQAADQQRAQIDMQRLQLQQMDSQTDAQFRQAQLQMQAQMQQAKMAMEAQQQQAQMFAQQQAMQAEQAREAARIEAENARKQAELAVREKMNTQDNLTAMQLAELELASGEKFAVSTGTGINPQP